MAEKEENVEVVESIPSKDLDSGGGRMKIIAIVIVAIVVVALLAYIFLLGDDNGNGGNGNGNRKPFADFTYTPETIYVNDTVNFDASNSTDLDGDDLTYEWEFGDIYSDSGNPNTDSGKIGTHVYTVAGDYEVTLVVDDGDKQDSKTKNVTVLPEETPTVNLQITKTDNSITNIMWRINFNSVEGTDEQVDTANIQFNFYNGSDTNDIKLTGFLSNLDETNTNPLDPNDDGIYFDDNDDNDILGELDLISIAGDGNADIQDGDYFQLIFVPNGVEMMVAEPLPS